MKHCKAIDAVPDGSDVSAAEIHLLKDTTEDISSSGKSYSLDMGGYTICGTGTGSTYSVKGGLLSSDATIVKIKNGVITGGHGGLDVKRKAQVFIEQVTVTGNGTSATNTIVDVMSADLEASDCRFTENYGENGKGYVFYVESGTCTLTSCQVMNNIGMKDTVKVAGTLTANTCRIAGNTAQNTGGVYVDPSGHLIMSGTIVTGNHAESSTAATGGIYIGLKGSITMTSGAVYDNDSASENGANDLYISQKTSLSIPAASNMADGDKSFKDYVWRTADGSLIMDAPLPPSGTDLCLTAYENKVRNVVSWNGEKYKSLL